MTDPLVVSDASIPIGLARGGLLGLLPALFREVVVPPVAFHEVTHNVSRPGAPEVAAAQGQWIRVEAPTSVPARPGSVNEGEWEAISLALERARAGAPIHLLLDERAARRLAESLGIRPTGVLGLVLLAKARGILAEVRPALDALLASGFRCADALYHEVLRAAGEEP